MFTLAPYAAFDERSRGRRYAESAPNLRTEFQRADPGEPAREVAQRIAVYNLLALPVIDDSGDILGIITVDDAMEILLPKDWRQRLPRLFG